MRAEEQTIATDVGWALWGDNLFRGLSVRDQIVGKHGFWSAVSFGIGGPLLSREQERYADAIATCLLAADPRIWPLKLTWLGACHGSAFAGLSTIVATFEHLVVGPQAVTASARVLESLAQLVQSSRQDQETKHTVRQWLKSKRDASERVPGFGVPARERDERSEMMKSVTISHERDGGDYFKLLLALEEAGHEVLGQAVNVSMALAACWLDLGLAPEHCSVLTCTALCMPLFANAVESAELKPAVLRELPLHHVAYCGPELRESHRKRHASEQHESRGL